MWTRESLRGALAAMIAIGVAVALALGIILFLAVIGFATRALAHDWYPLECCHDQDCAPVEKVEMVAGATFSSALGLTPMPMMVVTTRHGTVVVPANFPRRQSPDARMHACIHAGQLLCLFLPPSL